MLVRIWISIYPWHRSLYLTCLSLRPSSNTSSIRVNFGCLLRSALSLISLGSNAILWPFSPASYEVSGPLVSREPPAFGAGAGEPTRLESISSPSPPPPPPVPPPRLLVNPDDITAIPCTIFVADIGGFVLGACEFGMDHITMH